MAKLVKSLESLTFWRASIKFEDYSIIPDVYVFSIIETILLFFCLKFNKPFEKSNRYKDHQ